MVIDANGLIASKTWAGTIDGGDSLSETGRIYFLKELCSINDTLSPFYNAAKALKNSDDQWIRNPINYSNPKDISRDQLDPMMMCLVSRELYGTVATTKNIVVSNWYRYPNGDMAMPDHMNHFTRYIKASYLGDLFMLLNVLFVCFITGSFKSMVKNDLNLIIALCFTNWINPTFISKLAAKIYLNHRKYLWALTNYYTPQTGNGDLINYYIKGLEWLRACIQK